MYNNKIKQRAFVELNEENPTTFYRIYAEILIKSRLTDFIFLNSVTVIEISCKINF